jgi:CheY-like chemotaxis protein
MVVEDEKLIGWSIREALKGEYHIRLAPSAEKAIQLLPRLRRLDAVLVDVRLPGIDGLEFVRHARAAKPDLKVFVMTAYNQETAPREAFGVRADGYLPKPFPMEMLRDMLASHLGNSHAS